MCSNFHWTDIRVRGKEGVNPVQFCPHCGVWGGGESAILVLFRQKIPREGFFDFWCKETATQELWYTNILLIMFDPCYFWRDNCTSLSIGCKSTCSHKKNPYFLWQRWYDGTHSECVITIALVSIVCPRGQPIGTINLVSSVSQVNNLLVLLILCLVFLEGTISHNLLVLLILCLVYLRGTTYWYDWSCI